MRFEASAKSLPPIRLRAPDRYRFRSPSVRAVRVLVRSFRFRMTPEPVTGLLAWAASCRYRPLLAKLTKAFLNIATTKNRTYSFYPEQKIWCLRSYLRLTIVGSSMSSIGRFIASNDTAPESRGRLPGSSVGLAEMMATCIGAPLQRITFSTFTGSTLSPASLIPSRPTAFSAG